jgi:hypothetical protein
MGKRPGHPIPVALVALLLQRTFKHALDDLSVLPIALQIAVVIQVSCTVGASNDPHFHLHLFDTQPNLTHPRKIGKSPTGRRSQAIVDLDDDLECLEQREWLLPCRVPIALAALYRGLVAALPQLLDKDLQVFVQ